MEWFIWPSLIARVWVESTAHLLLSTSEVRHSILISKKNRLSIQFQDGRSLHTLMCKFPLFAAWFGSGPKSIVWTVSLSGRSPEGSSSERDSLWSSVIREWMDVRRQLEWCKHTHRPTHTHTHTRKGPWGSCALCQVGQHTRFAHAHCRVHVNKQGPLGWHT